MTSLNVNSQFKYENQFLISYAHAKYHENRRRTLTIVQELTPFDFEIETERSDCAFRNFCNADNWQSADTS